MFKKIMVPVDLMHIERLDKAITTATDLAKHHGIPLCFVGVTPTSPTELASTPEEYAQKLEDFGAEQSATHGLTIDVAAYPSHDPAAELDKLLIAAGKETGADLIVMASHVPGLPEHIFASNAGYVASHAEVSVFVIR